MLPFYKVLPESLVIIRINRIRKFLIPFFCFVHKYFANCVFAICYLFEGICEPFLFYKFLKSFIAQPNACNTRFFVNLALINLLQVIKSR